MTTNPDQSKRQQIDPLVEALRIAAGDIIYLANERNELERFRGTLDQIASALEPYQFWDTEGGHHG